MCKVSRSQIRCDLDQGLLRTLRIPEEFATARGEAPDLSRLKDDPGLRAAIDPVVERVNRELSNLEKVRRFAIAPEPFTVENQMMTPTLKIRRHQIVQVHGDTIRALY